MRVAAIDLGTNSVHLVVADVGPDGGITVVEKSRQQIELGRGGFEAHHITDEAMDRAIETMGSFHHAMELLGVEAIHAAATSAVREAENGSTLCRRIGEKTGIHVRVVSGLEEARLIWLGARENLDPSRSPALMIDIGGGSVELMVCDPQRMRSVHSLPAGYLRLGEQLVRSDPPTADEIGAVRKHVRALLTPVVEHPSTIELGAALGTSGSIRTLGRMATLMRGAPVTPHDHGLVLQRSELKKLLEKLVSVKASRRVELPGMDPRRSETLPVAAAILYQIMKSLGVEELSTSEAALREGLLYEWIDQHRPELALSGVATTPRMRSVLHLMNKYGEDQAHARHVRDLALSLFDALESVHGLGEDSRALLEYAALLHDIGHHIDARDHNKHGEYLILNTRMPGFTTPEITALASLVRFHRGSRPKTDHRAFRSMSKANQSRSVLLAALLRLADAFDRSHHQPVSGVSVAVRDDSLEIVAHARDEAFLERWAAEHRADALAEAVGRRVSVALIADGPPVPLAPPEAIG
jgi:exopolyphosphatase / guanosine-5'-triphosphate,3'-diphosphate pyrophosphatase